MNNQSSLKNNNNHYFTIDGIEFCRSIHGAYEYILPKRYIPKELIGYGSFGSVVDAFDAKENRTVAIKKIQNLKDEVDIKRVLREIFILKYLKHDNIIPLYDVFFVKK